MEVGGGRGGPQSQTVLGKNKWKFQSLELRGDSGRCLIPMSRSSRVPALHAQSGFKLAGSEPGT